MPVIGNATARVEIESNVDDAPIEIVDSDEDNDEMIDSGMQALSNGDLMDLNASHESSNDVDNSDVGHIDTEMNNANDVEVNVKYECKVEREIEVVDLPFDVFDPNKGNKEILSIENRAPAPKSMDNQSQTNSSTNAQKQAKQGDGNRFKRNTSNRMGDLQTHRLIHDTAKSLKCEHCDHAARRKAHLILHQRTHEHQKLMGAARNPKDGLFKCTHCDQRFKKLDNFKIHLAKLHKDNQRLFNCKRCMRRFTQIIEKDEHEVHCTHHRYECYLCKNYVLRNVTHLKMHMRTHTGAKPFECSICNRCFRQKGVLTRHLNSVHSHT